MAKFFQTVGLVFQIARNLIAYTISMFVLFGIPYFLGKLVWASPVTGDFTQDLLAANPVGAVVSVPARRHGAVVVCVVGECGAAARRHSRAL